MCVNIITAHGVHAYAYVYCCQAALEIIFDRIHCASVTMYSRGNHLWRFTFKVINKEYYDDAFNRVLQIFERTTSLNMQNPADNAHACMYSQIDKCLSALLESLGAHVSRNSFTYDDPLAICVVLIRR